MFSRAIRIARLLGFDIKVDASWLLIAGLITWTLAHQYFPMLQPSLSQYEYLAIAFVAMIGFFASLLLHELAHSVIARQHGLPIKGITLFLFGGVAELEEEPRAPHVEFQVAIAGPLMSFGLAIGFWMLAQLSELMAGGGVVTTVLSYLGTINLVLAIFNLLPAFPLDGGRVLRAWLWARSGDLLRATRIASQAGAVLAYALMGLGLLLLFQGSVATGMWQLLIGGFLLFASQGSYQTQLAKRAFAGKQVADLMTRGPITVSPDIPLSQLAEKVILGRNVSFVPVVDEGVLLGHIDRGMLRAIDRENWPSVRVGDVFAGLDTGNTVPSDMEVSDLFEQITRTGTRKYLVTRRGQLTGVISLSDLTRFLQSTQSLTR